MAHSSDMNTDASVTSSPTMSSPRKHEDHDQWSVNLETPRGWKYKRWLGLPYPASPQFQLVLVAFICFLCPGESIHASPKHLDSTLTAAM